MSAELRSPREPDMSHDRGDAGTRSSLVDRGLAGALRSALPVDARSMQTGISADEVSDAVGLVQSVARLLKEAEEEKKAREVHVHSVVTHITNELENAKKRIDEANQQTTKEAARADAAEARAEQSEQAFRQLVASINAEFG